MKNPTKTMLTTQNSRYGRYESSSIQNFTRSSSNTLFVDSSIQPTYFNWFWIKNRMALSVTYSVVTYVTYCSYVGVGVSSPLLCCIRQPGNIYHCWKLYIYNNIIYIMYNIHVCMCVPGFPVVFVVSVVSGQNGCIFIAKS